MSHQDDWGRRHDPYDLPSSGRPSGEFVATPTPDISKMDMTCEPGTVVRCYATVTEKATGGWSARIFTPSSAAGVGSTILLPEDEFCTTTRMRGSGARTRISKHRVLATEIVPGRVVAVLVRFTDTDVSGDGGRHGDPVRVKRYDGKVERWGVSLQPRDTQKAALSAA